MSPFLRSSWHPAGGRKGQCLEQAASADPSRGSPTPFRCSICQPQSLCFLWGVLCPLPSRFWFQASLSKCDSESPWLGPRKGGLAASLSAMVPLLSLHIPGPLLGIIIRAPRMPESATCLSGSQTLLLTKVTWGHCSPPPYVPASSPGTRSRHFNASRKRAVMIPAPLPLCCSLPALSGKQVGEMWYVRGTRRESGRRCS